MKKIRSTCLMENKEYSNNKYKDIANKLKKYIDDNYENPNLSVELIAEYIGLSPNYIRTIFKKNLGISISNYIIEIRFLKAQQMLKQTNYTVKKIATLVGFYDTRYVYISFKKFLGITAMEYRKSFKSVSSI